MRNFFCFLLILISFCACKHAGPGNTEIQSPHQQLVEKYFGHFNRHDWKQMAALYAETAEFKDPSLGQGVVKQTRQQIIDKYTELGNLFPDVNDEIVRLYPAGDRNIVVEFVSSGTAPDSTRFTLPICTIFTIENGLITKDFTYYDNFEPPSGK